MEIGKMTAKQFRRIRKTAGLSQVELGEMIGYKQRWIRQFENGEAKIPSTVIHYMDQLSRRGG